MTSLQYREDDASSQAHANTQENTEENTTQPKRPWKEVVEEHAKGVPSQEKDKPQEDPQETHNDTNVLDMRAMFEALTDAAKQAAKKNAKQAAKQVAGTVAKSEKKPTVSFEWAELVLAGTYGEYAYDAQGDTGIGVLYRWNDTYWEEHSLELMKLVCADWFHTTYPERAEEQRVNNACKYAQLLIGKKKPLAAKTKDYVLAVKGAYLFIEADGRVMVHAPDKTLGITHAARAGVSTPIGSEHVPQDVPDDSLFGQFLQTSLPDQSVRELVQELCAMTFLPRSLHKAAWFWGEGRNGKGVLSKLVQMFHARPVTLSMHRLGADFGLETIVGASLLVVDEVARKRWDEEVFKPLVSGDAVQVNRKHLKSLPTYYNHATLMICSNDPPFITDNSNGVHERICTVRWDVVIPEEKRVVDLEQKIMDQEAHIFLDWILQGIQRILKRGGFRRERDLPGAVLEQKRQLRELNDPIGAWVNECGVTYDPTESIEKKRAYQAFADWCEADGREVLAENTFWRSLGQRSAFSKLQANRQSRRTRDGRREYVVNLHIPTDAELAARRAKEQDKQKNSACDAKNSACDDVTSSDDLPF